VYLLKTRFNQHGYTWINTGTKAPVRPHRHDDIERFMLAALPYYTTVGITVFSFVAFSYLFLYHLDNKN